METLRCTATGTPDDNGPSVQCIYVKHSADSSHGFIQESAIMTAQIRRFLITSAPYDYDVLCELDTLAACMTEITDMIGQHDMHKYFPVRVVLEDTNGKETTVCTVSL
jgi:hypothetical protein